jgi:N-acetylglucosamine-6-phosphate deacetylase
MNARFVVPRRGRGVSAVVTLLLAMALAFAVVQSPAQPPSTVQPEGLRQNTPAVHALVNARLVLFPGRTIEKGTVVVRDGVIVAVGEAGDTVPPADARVWDLSGRTVYPGLIDAYSELSEPQPRGAGAADGAGPSRRRAGAAPSTELLRPASTLTSITGGATYWTPRVSPQFRADRQYRPDAEANKKLRAQGVVARLVAPPRQIIKGTSAAVGTGDDDGSRSVLRSVVAMHVQLMPPGGPGTERGYPVSPMGAVALVRQAMYDAQWYGKARVAWEADPALARPERNDALEALQPVVAGSLPVMIDAPDQQYALRADRVAKEFKLNAILHGSGQEYRRLEDVVATGRAIVVPVNFAKAPNIASPEAAIQASLEDLLDWDLQPENPARLERAGVKFALTGHGLKDKDGGLLKAVGKAVARGLPADAALRALTVTPAELLGLSRSHGSIEVGKSASFVVADGELFDEKTKVLETWVDGTRYEVVSLPKGDVRGTWAVKLGEAEAGAAKAISIKLTGDAGKPKGKIVEPGSKEGAKGFLWFGDKAAAAPRPAGKGKEAGKDLANVAFAADNLSFTFKGESIGQSGVVQVSVNVSGDAWAGKGVLPDGTTFPVTASRTAAYSREEERQDRAKEKEKKDRRKGEDDGDAEGGAGTTLAEGKGPATRPAAEVASVPARPGPPPGERERPTTEVTPGTASAAKAPATQPAALAQKAEKASTQPALFEVLYPLGAFGRSQQPEQPAVVLFKNATVWTSGPRGKLAKASVLVERGKIAGVYADGETVKALPDHAVVIDCEGKHLSPGIIDCHSHIATDGGVNEASQSVTCEVRIGDFIDPDDVNIYRQLAGGVTAANVLHGSANTIGGQNQVIKLRWGAGDEAMKFAGAQPGVKFALGENVKQSNWGDEGGTRYPQTRMGVDQIVRDSFNAAKDYRRAWDEFTAGGGKGIPPRVDLKLDALAEIVSGRRLIHCHSYRQDEILALIRTCEQFGVKVATFQHVLEGYKIADAIARHGAGGSTFSDWWAYKFEVYDAVPYNGSLMRDAGVVVSYNSDDAELARRLNTEAAKALKYGNVPEEEALKFVTLNPAKQLRIDGSVGSIEVGKDADLVVWSGSPLSGLSRCEQTWVDGRRYFDRQEDQSARKQAATMRAALVQKILGGGEPMAEADEDEKEPRPRDLWRQDENGGACDCGAGMFLRR